SEFRPGTTLSSREGQIPEPENVDLRQWPSRNAEPWAGASLDPAVSGDLEQAGKPSPENTMQPPGRNPFSYCHRNASANYIKSGLYPNFGLPTGPSYYSKKHWGAKATQF